MKRWLLAFCLMLVATAASAQFMLLTGAGLGAGGLDPFSLSYVGAAVNAADGTSYTFTSQNVGTDASGGNARYTVVGVGGQGSAARTVSSVTICGLTASEAVTDNSDVATASIFYADTTGQGTSCSIAVTFSGFGRNAGIAIFRMINPASSVPDGNACDNTVTSNHVDPNIDISPGGAAVGYAVSQGETNRTFTWSGLGEDLDGAIESGGATHSAAHGGSAGTPATISVTRSGTSDGLQGCAASWH